MRSDRGLPSNITTVLFENWHWDCRPSAFFMPVFHFMPHFDRWQVFFFMGSKLFFISSIYNNKIHPKKHFRQVIKHIRHLLSNKGYIIGFLR